MPFNLDLKREEIEKPFEDITVNSNNNMNNETFEYCDLDEDFTEEEALLQTAKGDDDGIIIGGRIDGEYKDYVGMLLDRHKERGRKVNQLEY